MQKSTQKYAIIQLFEYIPAGTQFSASNWPLHSTIADTFAIEWDVPVMIMKLTELFKNHEQAASTAQEDRYFGEDNQVQVTLLDKTDSLMRLHSDVIELLERGGWQPNDPQFAKDNFLPHATVQKHSRLSKGNKVTFNALSIIDFFPAEDPYERKLVKTIGLLG